MFITLTRLHDYALDITPAITNHDGALHIALLSLDYEVCYHNLRETSVFVLSPSEKEYKNFAVSSGAYTPERLARYLTKNIPSLEGKITRNRHAAISMDDGVAISLEDDLREILGFDERLIQGSGEHVGARPVSLPPIHDWLYIHLDQLSTAGNIVDGGPSTLLAAFPAAEPGVVEIASYAPTNPRTKNCNVETFIN